MCCRVALLSHCMKVRPVLVKKLNNMFVAVACGKVYGRQAVLAYGVKNTCS